MEIIKNVFWLYLTFNEVHTRGVGVFRGKMLRTCHFETNWDHNSVSLNRKVQSQKINWNSVLNKDARFNFFLVSKCETIILRRLCIPIITYFPKRYPKMVPRSCYRILVMLLPPPPFPFESTYLMQPWNVQQTFASGHCHLECA